MYQLFVPVGVFRAQAQQQTGTNYADHLCMLM